MCGIFGISTKNGGISRELLENATRSLAHRGPDDSGTAVIAGRPGDCQTGFAHTRLSIIDLSPLGHQPMQDDPTGNWIAFNGEIYNFRELRTQLIAAGNRFHSESDTEVILTAYRMWGMDCFSRLRGMFALALWDASLQTLLLARDPMGIKPLYYYHSSQYFLFASEVRTLLRTGLVPRKLDPDGVFSFLAFGSVYEPSTIIEGICAVPAAHVLSLKEGLLQSHAYWNPLPHPSSEAAQNLTPQRRDVQSLDDEPVRRLPHLLRDAVMSHLVSDVPVGVFLSGGIDSSSLVAIMSQVGVRATTFSLVFREQEFNEAQYSRQIAAQFQTDHHEILISQQDALAAVPEALCAMDQPSIDGINTWLVSAKTRAAGVKVALTGLGADEMFGGYSNFRYVPRMEKVATYFSKLPSLLRKPMAAVFEVLAGNNDRNRKLKELGSQLAASKNTPSHPYFVIRNLFTAAERHALYSGDAELAERNMASLLQASIAVASNLDPVNRVSYLESHWYMRNTLLRDSDVMSMAHGLELRVPFLDRDLVEACFRIPGKLKLRGDSPKSLLLASLGVELPREIVHRPKRGFTLPFERWLRAEMKPIVEDTFSKADASQAFLRDDATREVWQRFLAGETTWSRPWSLFVLKRWCEQNL
jgi:asparagine synthase (glutamine-hydrolysing)